MSIKLTGNAICSDSVEGKPKESPFCQDSRTLLHSPKLMGL